MISLNTINQGDCLELLRQMPDESVDVTFADPPFNLKKKYKSYSDQMALDDYLQWCKLWLVEMVRITKPTGSIFVHNIPKWLTYYTHFLNEVSQFRNWIAWDAPGAPMGKGLLPNHYGILYYVKDKKIAKYNDIRYPHSRSRKDNVLLKDYGGKKGLLHPYGPLVSDVWSDLHRIRHNKRRDEHPCQLPIPLLERIILMTTDEDDIVLDPFCGTGTTVVAAKRLGRQYIGFELDASYVEISQRHLETIAMPSKIHGSWVSIYLNKIVTLRDQDWNALKEHFIVPSPPEAIETRPIQYKHGTLRVDEVHAVLPIEDENLIKQLSLLD
jgi:site-specific DNA-methyltransferase (adenine-specific)